MPNRTSFLRTIAKARAAGDQAAEERHAAVAGNLLWTECGGAHMSLVIEDEKWRRFFDSLIEKPLQGLRVSSAGQSRYSISIARMATYQEVTVCLAAANAALEVLEIETGGKGESQGYLS